jgi:hypothetical protein
MFAHLTFSTPVAMIVVLKISSSSSVQGPLCRPGWGVIRVGERQRGGEGEDGKGKADHEDFIPPMKALNFCASVTKKVSDL